MKNVCRTTFLTKHLIIGSIHVIFFFQILSAAVLACATGAPSGAFFAPIVPYPLAYSAVAIPAAVPTIPAGDLQAAAINAQVQVQDLTRAAADQARELAEQAVEKQDEGVIEANDLAKERAEESFWAAEEKKWQALDALKTAEAQVEGSVASADGAIAAAYTVPAAVAQPAVESAAVVAEAKSAAPEPAKAEEKKENVESEASAAVKSAETESKPVENVEKSEDSVQVEAAKVESAAVKASEAIKDVNTGFATLTQTHPSPVISAAFVAQPWLNPGIAPISYVPGLKSYVPSVIPNYNAQLLNPGYYRAVW